MVSPGPAFSPDPTGTPPPSPRDLQCCLKVRPVGSDCARHRAPPRYTKCACPGGPSQITDHFRPLALNPSTSPRAAPRDLGRSRAISGDLGTRGRAALSRAISAERRSRGGTPAQKRKEVGGRRSRPIQSAVVAGFLAPGSSPDGCCAGQQTIGRRDDAPSGTLPPPPGYCRTSALSGGIFPSLRFFRL